MSTNITAVTALRTQLPNNSSAVVGLSEPRKSSKGMSTDNTALPTQLPNNSSAVVGSSEPKKSRYDSSRHRRPRIPVQNYGWPSLNATPVK